MSSDQAPDDSNILIAYAKEQLACLLQQLHAEERLKEKEVNCLSRVIMSNHDLLEEFLKCREQATSKARNSRELDSLLISWILDQLKDPRVSVSLSPSPVQKSALSSPSPSQSPVTPSPLDSRNSLIIDRGTPPLSSKFDMKDSKNPELKKVASAPSLSKLASPIQKGFPHYMSTDEAIKLALSLHEGGFRNIFLLSFRKFISPLKLFTKVCDFVYHPPSEEIVEKKEISSKEVPKKIVSSSPLNSSFSGSKSESISSLDVESVFDDDDDPVMLRKVFLFLNSWITDYYDLDFSSKEMKDKLSEFVAHINSICDTSSVRTLRKTIEKQESRVLEMREAEVPSIVGIRVAGVDILRVPPAELAKELTLLEFSHFKRIHNTELIDHRWKDKSLGPNANDFIERFNRLAYWVATEILDRKTNEERVAVVHHFIDVAGECLKLNNFHVLFAVPAALAFQPVFRLKDLRGMIDSSHQKVYDNLLKVTSTDDNYKAYRSLLKQCIERGIPCLPHLAINFKDLFVFEELTPYEIENKLQILDIHRLDRVYQDVNIVITFTRREYPKTMKANAGFQIALREQINKARTADQLTQRSLEIEPRMNQQQQQVYLQQKALNVLLEEGFL